VAAFLAHVQWGIAVYQLAVPTIRLDRDYLTTIVAILARRSVRTSFFGEHPPPRARPGVSHRSTMRLRRLQVVVVIVV
jgi:hypothetical protein